MNAKLKARELVDKFKYLVAIDDSGEPIYEFQKDCALIAVDELLDVLHKGAYEDEDSNMNYWIEVRDEIRKL